MSAARRIWLFLSGLLMIAGSLLMILLPEIGYVILTLALGIVLMARGIRMLCYYFSQARLMVDGRSILVRAVVLIDLGAFTLSLSDVPKFFLVLYLVVVYAFSGVIHLLRGLESKKHQDPSWKKGTAHGVINLVCAVLCLIFYKQTWLVVLIYGIGLIHSGGVHIIMAFRRTKIVYIQ